MGKSDNTRWYWCLAIALVLAGAGGVVYFVLKDRAQQRAEQEAEEQALKEIGDKLTELKWQSRLIEEELRVARRDLAAELDVRTRSRLHARVFELQGRRDLVMVMRDGLLRGLDVVEDEDGRIVVRRPQ
jgi:hypothetical protein